jgi:hypothetical protein
MTAEQNHPLVRAAYANTMARRAIALGLLSGLIAGFFLGLATGALQRCA